MNRPLADILEDTIDSAEAQLEAARRLDAGALHRATVRRQDLLFELQLIQGAHPVASDGELRRLGEELKELDLRLSRLLESGLAVFRQLKTETGAPPVYSSRGRMRETSV